MDGERIVDTALVSATVQVGGMNHDVMVQPGTTVSGLLSMIGANFAHLTVYLPTGEQIGLDQVVGEASLVSGTTLLVSVEGRSQQQQGEENLLVTTSYFGSVWGDLVTVFVGLMAFASNFISGQSASILGPVFAGITLLSVMVLFCFRRRPLPALSLVLSSITIFLCLSALSLALVEPIYAWQNTQNGHLSTGFGVGDAVASAVMIGLWGTCLLVAVGSWLKPTDGLGALLIMWSVIAVFGTVASLLVAQSISFWPLLAALGAIAYVLAPNTVFQSIPGRPYEVRPPTSTIVDLRRVEAELAPSPSVSQSETIIGRSLLFTQVVTIFGCITAVVGIAFGGFVAAASATGEDVDQLAQISFAVLPYLLAGVFWFSSRELLSGQAVWCSRIAGSLILIFAVYRSVNFLGFFWVPIAFIVVGIAWMLWNVLLEEGRRYALASRIGDILQSVCALLLLPCAVLATGVVQAIRMGLL